MRVQLHHIDGKLPNLALMRLAGYYRREGAEISLIRGNPERQLWEAPDKVYGSCIFVSSRPVAQRLLQVHPEAIIGGTGWNPAVSLEQYGLAGEPDYSIYPDETRSIGFSQRGCRLRCSFCVVPEKEGAVKANSTISSIWRGHPWPKHLLLLDNDFFGQERWRDRIAEIRDGHFKVCFNQGINARFLTDEAAEAIASVDYRDDSMAVKRIYTAWDNRKDEHRLFAGLNRLVKYGVKPDHIMVYMLIGYWPGETHVDRDFRRAKLREFGARPYPMPYARTPELVGFQRWVIGAYDKPRKDRPAVSWAEFAGAKYEPRNLGRGFEPTLFNVLDGAA